MAQTMTPSIPQVNKSLIIGFPKNIDNSFPWDKYSFQVEKYPFLLIIHGKSRVEEILMNTVNSGGGETNIC